METVSEPLASETVPLLDRILMRLSRWGSTVFVAVSLVFFLINLAFNLQLALSQSIDIRGVEPNVAYGIQQLLSGNPLYSDPEESPFAIIQYPPLYYTVVEFVARALDIAPSEILEIYRVGRLISLGCSLIIFLVVLKTSQAISQSYRVAIPVAVTAFVVTTPWYMLLRPDALTALFGVSGLVLASAVINSDGATRRAGVIAFAAGACCCLSILAKQSSLIFPLIVIVALVALRRWRPLLIFGLGLGLPFLAALAPAMLSSAGVNLEQTPLWKQLVQGVNNGTDLANAVSKAYAPLVTQFAILLVACLSLIVIGLKHQLAHKTERLGPPTVFWGWAFIALMGFGAVTAMKAGSAVHYFNEAFIAGLLFITAFYADPAGRRYFAANGLTQTLLAVGQVFLVASILIQNNTDYQHHLSLTVDQQFDREVIAFLENEFAQHPESTMYAFLDRALILRFFDRAIFPQPEIVALNYPLGIYDYRNFARLVDDGTIRYFVARNRVRFPGLLYDARLGALDLVFQNGRHFVYLNAPPQTQ